MFGNILLTIRKDHLLYSTSTRATAEEVCVSTGQCYLHQGVTTQRVTTNKCNATFLCYVRIMAGSNEAGLRRTTSVDDWITVKVTVTSEDLERLPFAWNVWVGFLGQMEQFVSSDKKGSKYNAVPFVINNPVEIGRLGRLVPRFTKSSTVGERMARVRFLQMVQLILVISVETKKEEHLLRHSLDSGKFSPG